MIRLERARPGKSHPACGRISAATLKYTSSDIASTIVVIIGLAISAGSSLRRVAAIGRRQPTSFAAMIAKKMVTACSSRNFSAV